MLVLTRFAKKMKMKCSVTFAKLRKGRDLVLKEEGAVNWRVWDGKVWNVGFLAIRGKAI
jgi:hypothetical protein